MVLLFRRYTAVHMYKRLSQSMVYSCSHVQETISEYVGRLESSTNFQGLTDLLCPLTDVAYIEDIDHLPPVIFNSCPV